MPTVIHGCNHSSFLLVSADQGYMYHCRVLLVLSLPPPSLSGSVPIVIYDMYILSLFFNLGTIEALDGYCFV